MTDGDRTRKWEAAGGYFPWKPPAALGGGDTGGDTRGGRLGGGEDLQIFHAELGDPEAPLLLLVHGFPTSSIDWFDVAGPLSESYRLVMLDFPGFGFSDKPKRYRYSIAADAELIRHYLLEIVGATEVSLVSHDRGDSIALALVGQTAEEDAPIVVRHLVLSNGNLYLPLSHLTDFQRLALDRESAPRLLEVLTPEMLAAGMGSTTFSPVRTIDDPAVAALADTFARNDGIAVLHDTIQYLVERSENEERWLERLAALPVPTTMVWGLLDTVSPPRVATHVWDEYLSTKPGLNSFWFLPHANHYLQHDQPAEFVAVVQAALGDALPEAPGPVSAEPGAPILVDRSRQEMPSARDVLVG